MIPGVAARRDVQVAVHHQPLPQLLAERGARDLFGALARVLVVARGKIGARGAFGQVVPVVAPGALDGPVAARRPRALAWAAGPTPGAAATIATTSGIASDAFASAELSAPGAANCARDGTKSAKPARDGRDDLVLLGVRVERPVVQDVLGADLPDTAQPLSRASRRMRSASRMLSRASSESVSASHSTSWCPRRFATMMRPTAEPSFDRVLDSSLRPPHGEGKLFFANRQESRGQNGTIWVVFDAQYVFGPATRLQAQAIGEPGHRTFRLMVESGDGRAAALWVEKEQLQALGLAVEQLLAEFQGKLTGRPPPPATGRDVSAQPDSRFQGRTPGAGTGRKRARDRAALRAAGVRPGGQSAPEEEEPSQPATFACRATRDQLRALSRNIAEVVAAGGRAARCAASRWTRSRSPRLRAGQRTPRSQKLLAAGCFARSAGSWRSDGAERSIHAYSATRRATGKTLNLRETAQSQ